jgi:hypothetical protein
MTLALVVNTQGFAQGFGVVLCIVLAAGALAAGLTIFRRISGL